MRIRLNDSGVSFSAFFLLLAITLSISGCAGIVPPTPGDMIKQPFGKSSLSVGMTKSQVEAMWGKPDEMKTVEDKAKWGGPREMWVYRARYGNIPVDVDYFSKTKKLYFDGDNLTNIE